MSRQPFPSLQNPITEGQAMRTLLPALLLIINLATGAASAQPFTPNEAGVTMGHWHLNSRDVEANKKVFVALGHRSLESGEVTPSPSK